MLRRFADTLEREWGTVDETVRLLSGIVATCPWQCDAVCRGSWRLGNNCGSCPRCRAEAAGAFAEREALRALAGQLAQLADESGWRHLAEKIRQRVAELAKAHEVTR